MQSNIIPNIGINNNFFHSFKFHVLQPSGEWLKIFFYSEDITLNTSHRRHPATQQRHLWKLEPLCGKTGSFFGSLGIYFILKILDFQEPCSPIGQEQNQTYEIKLTWILWILWVSINIQEINVFQKIKLILKALLWAWSNIMAKHHGQTSRPSPIISWILWMPTHIKKSTSCFQIILEILNFQEFCDLREQEHFGNLRILLVIQIEMKSQVSQWYSFHTVFSKLKYQFFFFKKKNILFGGPFWPNTSKNEFSAKVRFCQF